MESVNINVNVNTDVTLNTEASVEANVDVEVNPNAYLDGYLSVHSNVYPSVCPSVYPSLYPNIYSDIYCNAYRNVDFSVDLNVNSKASINTDFTINYFTGNYNNSDTDHSYCNLNQPQRGLAITSTVTYEDLQWRAVMSMSVASLLDASTSYYALKWRIATSMTAIFVICLAKVGCGLCKIMTTLVGYLYRTDHYLKISFIKFSKRFYKRRLLIGRQR